MHGSGRVNTSGPGRVRTTRRGHRASVRQGADKSNHRITEAKCRTFKPTLILTIKTRKQRQFWVWLDAQDVNVTGHHTGPTTEEPKYIFQTAVLTAKHQETRPLSLVSQLQ